MPQLSLATSGSLSLRSHSCFMGRGLQSLHLLADPNSPICSPFNSREFTIVWKLYLSFKDQLKTLLHVRMNFFLCCPLASCLHLLLPLTTVFLVFMSGSVSPIGCGLLREWLHLTHLCIVQNTPIILCVGIVVWVGCMSCFVWKSSFLSLHTTASLWEKGSLFSLYLLTAYSSFLFSWNCCFLRYPLD